MATTSCAPWCACAGVRAGPSRAGGSWLVATVSGTGGDCAPGSFSGAGARGASGRRGGGWICTRGPGSACWLRRECKSAEVASSAEREPVLGEGNEAALKMHGDIYHFSDLIFN